MPAEEEVAAFAISTTDSTEQTRTEQDVLVVARHRQRLIAERTRAMAAISPVAPPPDTQPSETAQWHGSKSA
jgi:hypothetical protein